MGDEIRLGVLPRTPNWRRVIGLVKGGASVAQIAAATLTASTRALRKAAEDEYPGLIYSAWLLAQVPLAARSPEFLQRLRAVGLSVPDRPSLLDVTGAFADAVHTHLRQCPRLSDIGEMAQSAAVGSIIRLVTDRTHNVFDTSTEDVQDALRTPSTAKQFGVLARVFLGGFIEHYLMYFLSRELSNHVGGERRFANIYEHIEFDKAFELHCHQAALVVERFAGEWSAKTNYEKGGVSPEDTAGFVRVVLKKLRAELRRGGNAC